MAGKGLYEAVRRDYWWPCLRYDCLVTAGECPGCRQEQKRFSHKLPLTPCIKPDQALLGWCFDLITGLELTPEVYRYLLVGIECFSKWTVIYPLHTKSSEEISDWFDRYFLP